MKIIKFIKEKILYFLLGGVCLASVGSQMLPAKVPALASLQTEYAKSSIQTKYKMQNASFIREAKDENAIQIEVGDKIKQEFVPSMKIAKWENEVSMRVSPKTNSKSKKKDFVIEGETIKYKEDKKEFHFYEIEDGYEVEVILLEKPKTNIVEMEIETDGLDFFYQPELTQQEIDEGCFRPENVIGSYAVYHSTKSNHILGQKNYQSGKAFHIFRPLIIDNLGVEVWGSLNIDVENNLLTVEIPQSFLETCQYPVRYASGLEFGYYNGGTPGGTEDGGSRKSVGITTFTNGATSGTLDKISVYFAGPTSQGPIAVDAGLYAGGSSPFSLLGDSSTLHSSAVSDPAQWVDFTMSGETISASTEYNIAVYYGGDTGAAGTDKITRYYDAGTTGQSNTQYKGANPSGTMPDPYTNQTSLDRVFSIYCTYSESGGEEEAPAKKQDVVWFE